MHVRRGLLGWGVFLIVAGSMPLAVRQGLLTSDQVADLWRLWPLIVIGIGVGLVLSRTALAFLGGLIVAATFGLIVGGALSGGFSGLPSTFCGPGDTGRAFPAHDGTIASGSSVQVHLACGSLDLATAPGETWHVEGRDSDGTGPTIEASATSLVVRPADAVRAFAFSNRSTWHVSLPQSAVLALDVQLDAGSANLALGPAALGDLDVQLDAASATLDLASVAAIGPVDLQVNAGSLGVTLPAISMKGTIEANAGAVRVCAPPDVALKITTGDNPLASYAIDGHGLVQDGSTWTSEGYDSASIKIEMDVSANAGSFTLDPEGGCG
jgi:hypothetical protein